jgi:hypothetical protein
MLSSHEFINPKDIQFRAFLLSAVSTGFHAVDALLRPIQPGEDIGS